MLCGSLDGRGAWERKDTYICMEGFPHGSVVTNLPAKAGDPGSTSGSGRSPGEGTGNPPQYSCLGNPMDRGAWRAIIHSVAELDTTEATEHTHTYVLQATHKATVFGSQISASTLNSYN